MRCQGRANRTDLFVSERLSYSISKFTSKVLESKPIFKEIKGLENVAS